MGILDTLKLTRLREGLAKTRENIFGKIQRILGGTAAIDDDLIEKLEEALIAGDVGGQTAAKIIGNLRESVRRDRIDAPSDLDALLRSEIRKLLHVDSPPAADPIEVPGGHKPHVIMVVGVNGVGKTTTIGKLAHNYKKAGNSVILGAGDTFRAAAVDQLTIWSERVGVPIVKQAMGSDPSAVAFDSVSSAVARNADVVIID